MLRNNHPDPLTLKEIKPDTVAINERGREWTLASLAVNRPRLEAFYGVGRVPAPRAAIEDDLTLVLFWPVANGKSICCRLDDESWDYI